MNSMLRYSLGGAMLALAVTGCESSKPDERDTADGYRSVKIGKQIWMVDNLNVNTFRNGEPIPHARTDSQWAAAAQAETPAWCYYEHDAARGARYGKLYNWYAVTDPRGLAPKGWRIPSAADYRELLNSFGTFMFVGDKLKAPTDWNHHGGGSNESGFTGLPGGQRMNGGRFLRLGYEGYWWCSSTRAGVHPPIAAEYMVLIYNDWRVPILFSNKGYGFSVRCVRGEH